MRPSYYPPNKSITNINQLDLDKRYSYADYLTWQFDDKVELIRGRVFKMTPAPGTSHQRLSGRFFRLIANYLASRPCQAFAAPFDVRLPLPPGQQKDATNFFAKRLL